MVDKVRGVLPYMGYIGMCAVKGMVFKQFTLRYGIYIIVFGSRIEDHSSGN